MRISTCSLLGRAAVGLTSVCCVACAPSLVDLPTDRAGTPFLARSSPLSEATRGCMSRLRVAGQADVAGMVSGRRVRAELRFAIMMSAATRLESAGTSDQTRFVLSTRGEDATLVLPQQNVVVEHERTARVLDAVLGVPLGAATLERLLLCPSGTGGFGSAEDLGQGWFRQHLTGADGGALVYIRHSQPGEWKLIAAIGRTVDGTGWRADYFDLRNGSWRRIRLRSVDPTGVTGRAYDLEWTLDDLQVNGLFDQGTLAASIPASARHVTLSELRGPGLLLWSGTR